MHRRLVIAGAALGLALAGLVAGIATGAVGGSSDASRDLAAAISPARPKNVILFVGDGMGESEVTAARYYQGAAKRLKMDAMPFRGVDLTWSVKPGAGPDLLPDYVPDSASTATEWSTGRKTIDERLSQGPSAAVSTPGTNQGYETYFEVATKLGKRTGDVSTAEITDATPAAPTSHISLRDCQGPSDARAKCPQETRAAGGPGSIAEQQVDHGTDVILGGGRARYEQPIEAGGTQTVLDFARGKGYALAGDSTQLEDLEPGAGKVLGLFTPGNMTQEWTGPKAAKGEGALPPARCTEGNRPGSEPSLASMTRKAIDLLEDDPDGFVLQVEGASIDKRDHAADACGQIGETVAFDRAVQIGLQYQRSHPDTLVVATADHSHTSQVVYDEPSGAAAPTGYSTNLLTKDGAPMRITYGTAGGSPAADEPPSQDHTGAAVPVFAAGPQGAEVNGTHDHTDLFGLLAFSRGAAADGRPRPRVDGRAWPTSRPHSTSRRSAPSSRRASSRRGSGSRDSRSGRSSDPRRGSASGSATGRPRRSAG